jgi:hypothetical protein
MVKDSVREVLEKDPKERTDEDIDILFEFMQSFPVITYSFLFNIYNSFCLFKCNKNHVCLFIYQLDSKYIINKISV